MEVQLTDGILFAIASGALGWVWRLQGSIGDLRTDLAVNNAKDAEIWKYIEKMQKTMEEIASTVNFIKEELAYQKGKKG